MSAPTDAAVRRAVLRWTRAKVRFAQVDLHKNLKSLELWQKYFDRMNYAQAALLHLGKRLDKMPEVRP